MTSSIKSEIESGMGSACIRCHFQSDSYAQGCYIAMWDAGVLLVASLNITHHIKTFQTYPVCVPELQPGVYVIEAREILYSGDLASTQYITTVMIPGPVDQGLSFFNFKLLQLYSKHTLLSE